MGLQSQSPNPPSPGCVVTIAARADFTTTLKFVIQVLLWLMQHVGLRPFRSFATADCSNPSSGLTTTWGPLLDYSHP